MTKKSFAILGLGKFGQSIALELSKAGAEVLAVDVDEERVQEVAPYITYAVTADICDATAMNSLGAFQYGRRNRCYYKQSGRKCNGNYFRKGSRRSFYPCQI